MLDLRTHGKTYHFRRILVLILAVALMFTYVLPIQSVFAEDDLAGPTIEEQGGGEPPADPEPPVVTVDSEDQGDSAGYTEPGYPVESLDPVDSEDPALEDPADLEEPADEEAIEDEEALEEDDEIEMPAVTFCKVMEDGTYITVSAEEGVLPAGTTMNAVKFDSPELENILSEKAAEEGLELVDYLSYDITLYDADGNEIQPNGEVEVMIYNHALVSGEGDLFMYHAHDAIEDMEKIADGAITATVENFSNFTVIAGERAKTHNWDTVLGTSNFQNYDIPANAQMLEFNDVSNNGHTYLDFVFLVISDEGDVTLIFLSWSDNKRFDAPSSYMRYAGISGTRVAHYAKTTKDMFAAFEVKIPSSMVGSLLAGNNLFIINEGNAPHSINGATLTFTNINYIVEHRLLGPNGESDSVLYLTTPGVGIEGQFVTAQKITIPGYTWSHGNPVSGTIPAGGLTLKMYYESDGVFSITAKSDSKTYDGTALTNSGYTTSNVPDGIKVQNVVVSGSQTDAGTGNNIVVSYQLIDTLNGNIDVTELYPPLTRANGGLVDGKLRVDKRHLEITADSDSKAYDGTPLTNDGYEITDGTIAAGQKLDSVNILGEITDPGEELNTPYGAVILDKDDKDVTSNYDIIYLSGMLEITTSEAAIVITVKDNTKKYDGTALVPVDRDVAGLPAGYTLTVTSYTGSITNVWESNTGLGGISGYTIIRNSDNKDVTNFFAAAEVVKGALTITKRTVIMTSGNGSWAYDGDAHSNTANPVITGDGFVTGQGATYSNFASITDVDESPKDNTFDYTLTSATDARNYDITQVYGELEITTSEAEIVITVLPNSKMYDGTALMPVDRSVAGLLDGHTLTVTGYTGSITNVWESGIELGGISGYTIIRESDDKDVTDFFAEANVNLGALTITKRAVTMTSEDGSWPYDGNAHSNDADPAITGDGFISGEGATYSNFASITDVDESPMDNTFDYALIDGTDARNYDITQVYGELEITTSEAAIIITVLPNSKIYDGTALVPVNRSVAGLLEGHTLNVTSYTGSIINVSQSAAGLGGISGYTIIRNSDGKNVTGFFKAAAVNRGALTINPRPVTITVADATKVAGTDDPAFTGSIVSGSLVGAGDLGTIIYGRLASFIDQSVGTYVDVLTAFFTANPNYLVTVIPGDFEITDAGGFGGGGGGGTTVTTTATTPATPTTPAITIEGEDTPLTIEPEPAPQAAPEITTIEADRVPLANIASWALLNLMLTIVTGLIMVALFATYFIKRKDDDEDDPDKEQKVKRHLLARLITIATTVVAIILFVMTQDMSLPMIFADQYTIWHIVIAAVTVFLALLSKKDYEEEELGEQRA